MNISVKISNDAEIQELNKKYRNKDEVTDVLSFGEESDEDYLGDIIINKDQAARQAGDHGNTLEEEIATLVKHGVLHLLGVHHKGDE
ncbi:rRNA maturation RNase YbeY [Patescibacteria group bacterium]